MAGQQKGQNRIRQEQRAVAAEAGTATHEGCCERQGNNAENRYDLVGNVVGQHNVKGNDEPRGEWKVEVQDWDASEPIIRPTNDSEVGQKLAPCIIGGPQMPSVVAAGWRGVGENEIDPQPHQHQDGDDAQQNKSSSAFPFLYRAVMI